MPEFSPNAKDIIKRMLDPNPSTRITLAEIKSHPFFANSWPCKILPSPVYHEYLTLTDDEKKVIFNLGYDSETEINAQLESEGLNYTKKFASCFWADNRNPLFEHSVELNSLVIPTFLQHCMEALDGFSIEFPHLYLIAGIRNETEIKISLSFFKKVQIKAQLIRGEESDFQSVLRSIPEFKL